MERRTGKMRGAFSRMHRALDGWMLARAPASPAQGLHHHGPRYFNFPYFCTIVVVVVAVVFTLKVVPIFTQYFLTSVLVQLTRTPSVVTG